MSKLSQAPLDFFRIGVGNPPNTQAPQLASTPSVGGVVASGIGQAAGAVGNYYAQQQLLNDYMKMQNQNQFMRDNSGKVAAGIGAIGGSI